MTSWKDICLKKNIINNNILEKNEKNNAGEMLNLNKYRNKEYVCIQYNNSFNDWFNFYENELFQLYSLIRNYIIERGYITAININENFIKFSKLIYLHSSKKLS